MDTKVTIANLCKAKEKGQKFAAVSCYDYTTARLLAQTDIKMVIVGDSASQVILGHDSTLPVGMDFMVEITAAVGRGAPNICLVADMPFSSYQTSLADTVRNASRFVAEASAQIVKIEVNSSQLSIIKAVSDMGVAVMAHFGIRPQTGRYKAEGTTAEVAAELIDFARQCVDAGASALLLEGIATEAARIITDNSPVPVVGCGSGPHCDGQVLVLPDVLGLTMGRMPKFSKAYGKLGHDVIEALSKYSGDISSGKFPDDAHSYHMKAGELEKLQDRLNR